MNQLIFPDIDTDSNGSINIIQTEKNHQCILEDKLIKEYKNK